ncbi:hypothetical protein FJTKL_12917 [Diaporthe vaccinii]|uniref:Heterokaryon incompatibility domain-containing protein n=1 Tax=Diaporthe vaccinii TaxID=105482 RepID=A0ABR4FAM2_9PEZI
MSATSLSDSQRRLAASTIYSEPLRPWETRALRLVPVHREHGEEDIVEVQLETAAIPHLEGLGLVGSGEVVLYEALSYTWDSPVLSHAIRCNGLDFSVTANLHAALVHLRSSHSARWLWIDALCINQYDEAEKERQVRNMFHIYRKASTVLVWLGPAGPGTCLGADILNVYDTIWQDDRNRIFPQGVRNVLMRRVFKGIDTNIYVHEFLDDLRDNPPLDDERAGADTLGLVSMALDGIADILGLAWVRRTWIIQELAAAANVKFLCGRSVLSYDAFFHVIPYVRSALWNTHSALLAGKEDPTVSERLRKRPRRASVSEIFGFDTEYDEPAFFRESLPFTKVLHELRLLVNDPAGRIKTRRTQTELLLVFLVETMSRGFDVSIAVDRVYSLTAMADAISSASWGLTHNKRTASSPQQVPVDYSVGLQAAVLRALKIRMNEMRRFYVAIERSSSLSVPSNDCGVEDQETKSVLFSMFSAYPSPPSWLRLLEPEELNLDHYSLEGGSSQESRMSARKDWRWTEQDVTEPDTLAMRGKALGHLVVDSGGHPSRIWVALPCPLGKEFEKCDDKFHKPVRSLCQGCPDERPRADDGANLDDTETGGERNEPSEQQTSFNQTGTGSDDDEPNIEVNFWSWQFPLRARDGDVIVVFVHT